ncbi:MAG: hypothetical protein RLZZ546_2126, partial [Bacteroidota bacterium]
MYKIIFILACIFFQSCAYKISILEFKKEIVAYQENKAKEHLNDPRSPIKNEEQIIAIKYFDIDKSYRVEAHLTKFTNQQPFDIPTYSGINKSYIKYGILKFRLLGNSYSLEVYQMAVTNPLTKSLLFLPFKDFTNGEASYGGGRYI